MADLVSYGNANRDIDQAIIAFKKGAQLLKYGRKGKPKFCPFRLSTVESSLIWISSSERSLELASVTRIVPGQRTDGRDLTSNSQSDSSASGAQDSGSPKISVSFKTNTSPKSFPPENSPVSERSHAASDQTKMQVKGSGSDAFRVSVSSAPSTSSNGSAPDDCEALGDVYVWGEAICDSVVKIGADKNANDLSLRSDVRP